MSSLIASKIPSPVFVGVAAAVGGRSSSSCDGAANKLNRFQDCGRCCSWANAHGVVAKFSGLRQRPDQHILCCAASRSRVGYRSDTDRIVEVWIRQHDTMGSYVVRASGVPLYVGYGSVFSIVSCIGLKLDRFVMQMALLLFHARTSARPPMTTEPTSPRHVGKHAMLARLASCPFMSLSELFDTCVRHDRTLFLLLVLIILQ